MAQADDVSCDHLKTSIKQFDWISVKRFGACSLINPTIITAFNIRFLAVLYGRNCSQNRVAGRRTASQTQIRSGFHSGQAVNGLGVIQADPSDCSGPDRLHPRSAFFIKRDRCIARNGP